MKNDLLKLIRWLCRRLTYNDLASVVPVLQEVLSGSLHDMPLKPADDRPPHYRQFRVDPTLPLTEPPEPISNIPDWRQLESIHHHILSLLLTSDLYPSFSSLSDLLFARHRILWRVDSENE